MALVYLDIETLPSEDKPKDAWSGDVKVGNRKPETAAAYRKEKEEEAWQRTALDTMFARVLCIGVAVGKGKPVCVFEDTERATLEQFAARLLKLDDRAKEKREPLRFVTHNGVGFDLPLLTRRLVRYADDDPENELNRAARLLWCPKRWGSFHHVDTMVVWEGASSFQGRGRKGLGAVCEFLGIDVEENPIDGSQVFASWEAGERDAIVQHVIQDVRQLQLVHGRLLAAGMVH